MGLLDLFKKKNGKAANETYIDTVRHIECGPWHQYDILLTTTIYGWEYMLGWADYVAGADMRPVDRVTVADIGKEEINVTDDYNNVKSIKGMECAAYERGSLGVAGTSDVLRGTLVKIVWLNQTRMLRIFVPFRNDELILKYVDTIVHRSFGKIDQMKLLATDIKVEDMLLASSDKGGKAEDIEDIMSDPVKYDAYLNKIASGIRLDDKRKILSLIEEGNIIMAVKVCREATGAGLKIAKDIVDEHSHYITL